MSGNVVLLNGTSSAGKSSIVRALQNRLDEPYLDLGIDVFIVRLPERYYGISTPTKSPSAAALDGAFWKWEDDDQSRICGVHLGPVAERVIVGMHHAMAGYARSGAHLIVDDVIFADWMLDDYLRVFDGLPVLFVGVRCSLEIAERRERDRGDRMIGTAAFMFDKVHTHGHYDIEVDTSFATPEACAEAIVQAMGADIANQAFERLRSERRLLQAH